MNKESIYRLIGYHGEYNDSVKKALRKLLKENHPDRQGNSEVFKLINEVKKELENNKVSIKIKSNNYKIVDDLDYDFCYEMIEKLKKEIDNINEEINKKQYRKNSLLKEYRILYDESIREASKLLNKKNEERKLKKIKVIAITIVLFLLFFFTLAVIKNNILLFIMFGLLCFIAITIIYRYFMIIESITKKSEKQVQKHITIIHKIKDLTDERELIKKEIVKLEMEQKRMLNDLRFYENLLKYKEAGDYENN